PAAPGARRGGTPLPARGRPLDRRGQSGPGRGPDPPGADLGRLARAGRVPAAAPRSGGVIGRGGKEKLTPETQRYREGNPFWQFFLCASVPLWFRWWREKAAGGVLTAKQAPHRPADPRHRVAGAPSRRSVCAPAAMVFLFYRRPY